MELFSNKNSNKHKEAMERIMEKIVMPDPNDTSEFEDWKNVKRPPGKMLKNYYEVELALIKPDPDQPRKINPNDPSLDELAESIKEHGVITPIHIREREEEGKEKYYQIVNGERRYWASIKAGLKTIPAKLMEFSEESDKAIKQLIDNLLREDLHPLEEAEGYQKLIENFNLTQEEVAKKVGKARNTITETLLLNSLPNKIKEQCLHGDIQVPKRFLKYVARQKNEKQQISLFNKFLKSSEPSENIINSDKMRVSPKMYQVYKFNLEGWKLEIKADKEDVSSIEILEVLEKATQNIEKELNK